MAGEVGDRAYAKGVEAVGGGEILPEDGRVLGRHTGIINFTVGQRRGLGIAAHEPLYVLRLDAARRQVVVGPRESLQAHTISLRNVNWLGDRPIPAGGMDVAVRVRSSGAILAARLHREPADGARVVLEQGEYGVSAGQACVFYADASPRARVLGGGFIVKAVRQPKDAELADAATEWSQNAATAELG